MLEVFGGSACYEFLIRRFHQVLGVVIACGCAFALIGGATVARDSDGASLSEIPFVGCPADGQMGPLGMPQGEPQRVAISAKIAHQLAYYEAKQGEGVFAPRGWHCRAWYGSSGSFLIVTPDEIPPPYFPPPEIQGPAVFVSSVDGTTSGRFRVAITAARLFPVSGKKFVDQVRAEHLVPDSSFDVRPFPSDRLQYLNDFELRYVTPGGHEGLGTQGRLAKSDRPVRGWVRFDSDADIARLTEVQLRLPKHLAELADVIMEIEREPVGRRLP